MKYDEEEQHYHLYEFGQTAVFSDYAVWHQH